MKLEGKLHSQGDCSISSYLEQPYSAISPRTWAQLNNISEDFLSMREDHHFGSFLVLRPAMHYFHLNLIEL